MADITFPCKWCGKHVQAESLATGRLFNCPHCDGFNRVPDRASVPEPVTQSRTPANTASASKLIEQSEKASSSDSTSRPLATPPVLRLTKRCPFCAEEIQSAAIKCKHCGEMVAESGQMTPKVSPSIQQRGTPKKVGAKAQEKPVFRWLWLAFFYGALGAPIGRNIGQLLPTTTPGGTAFAVAASVAVFILIGWFLGHVVAMKLSQLNLPKPAFVGLAWAAAIVGFSVKKG
jgi:hypothetical protein